MKSFFFREASERLLYPGMLAPFLLVPPLLAVTVNLETTVSSLGGILPVFEPVDADRGRLAVALWNATVVVALLSGVNGARFFSGTFRAGWFRSCLALPVNRSGAFWSTALAHFLISVCVLALTGAAIIAAVSVPAGFPLILTIIGALTVLFWTTAFSAFAGVLSPGWGAGLLQAGIALGSLVLAPVDVDQLFRLLGLSNLILPPLGRIIARGMACWPDVRALLVLMAHAAVFSCLGSLLLEIAIRRRAPKAES
jgi:hypothetical protein